MKNLKKILIALLVLCIPVLFFPVSAQVKLDYQGQEQDMQNARELVRAYESGDWEVLRDLTQPDAVFYNLGTYDSLDVEQTINYWEQGRKAATPVLSEDGSWLGIQIPEGPRKGKWVLHWGNNTLTYPNGETISFPYHVAMKFKENKVEEVHFYYDNNRIVRALGYDIQPPLSENEEEDNDFR